MSKVYRKTYAEVNLTHLYHNYVEISKLSPNKTIIPVVKANAYGHGAIEVVRFLVSKNVTYFAVSLLEEAIEIRNEFPNVDILIMGYVQKEYFELAAVNNFTVTISDMDQIEDLDEFNEVLKVHVKIDSGMNRLGFKSNKNIVHAISILKTLKCINLEGIYTHFATADGNKEYFEMQLLRFKEVLKLLDYDFKIIHVSNSSSIIKYESAFDFTTHARLGISLYGLTLDDNVTFLKNTYRLISHISEIKELNPGDKVGYGATYTAENKELIGILPIGYADGFIRQNQGGDVEINGKRYQIIGRICMDQLFVKIDETISKKDPVVMFGDIVSIDEVAKRLNTINYEIICQITYRVPIKYVK